RGPARGTAWWYRRGVAARHGGPAVACHARAARHLAAGNGMTLVRQMSVAALLVLAPAEVMAADASPPPPVHPSPQAEGGRGAGRCSPQPAGRATAGKPVGDAGASAVLADAAAAATATSGRRRAGATAASAFASRCGAVRYRYGW